MSLFELLDTLQERPLSSQEMRTLVSAWGRAAQAGDADEADRLRASFAHSHHCCGPNVADPSPAPDPPEGDLPAWSPSARLEGAREVPIEPPDPYPSVTSPRPTRVEPKSPGIRQRCASRPAASAYGHRTDPSGRPV